MAVALSKEKNTAMQRFDRKTEAPPKVLSSKVAGEARHRVLRFMYLPPGRRSQTDFPLGQTGLEGSRELSTSLSQLFRGRCAFCEAITATEPYHFRPPRDAHPIGNEVDPHLYYAWLETAWENLYPICRSCIPKDPTYFPVAGKRCPIPSVATLQRFVDENDGIWWQAIKESPRLIDPCNDKDFHTHLRPDVTGHLSGMTARGEATIEHFNLNRPERVRQRRNRYAEYWSKLMPTLTERHLGDIDDMLAFGDLEFGGSWQLLLRGIIQELARGAGLSSVPVFSRWREFLHEMVLRGDTGLIERALNGPRMQQAERARKDQRRAVNRPVIASIDSISLKNFKAIEDLTINVPQLAPDAEVQSADQPVPSLLILGENAAGKSSILEAIALVVSEKHARDRIRDKADFHSWVLDPKFFGKDESAPRMATVTITRSNGAQRRLMINGSLFEDSTGDDWQPLPVFAYGAFRQFNHRPSSAGADRHVRNLFVNAELPNPEQWLLSLPEARFNMVIRALRDILAVEGEFDVVERDLDAKKVVVATRVEGSGTTVRTPLHAVSSGFRSVLAMTCDVMGGLMSPKTNPDFDSLKTAQGVILIDEVEAHLHPRWKMRIMQGLRRALPRMTFIATSHDPLCLRGMDEGEVLVLQRVAGAEAAPLSDMPVFVDSLHSLPSISQLRVDQLLTSDFFQMYSTDDPAFEAKMAKIADSLNRDEATLDAGEIATLDEYRRDLAHALPIGSTEAHRIVQEAVAEYLQKRRSASEQTIKTLRDTAKKRIVDALGGR